MICSVTSERAIKLKKLVLRPPEKKSSFRNGLGYYKTLLILEGQPFRLTVKEYLKALVQAHQAVWADISAEEVRSICASAVARFNLVVKNRGGYVEHLLNNK